MRLCQNVMNLIFLLVLDPQIDKSQNHVQWVSNLMRESVDEISLLFDLTFKFFDFLFQFMDLSVVLGLCEIV